YAATIPSVPSTYSAVAANRSDRLHPSAHPTTSSPTAVNSRAIGKCTTSGWRFGAQPGTKFMDSPSPRGHPPRRDVGPLIERIERPACGLVLVAGRAGIGDAVLVRHRGRDEVERVAAYPHVGNGRGNLRHVTRHAPVPLAAGAVVRVHFRRH